MQKLLARTVFLSASVYLLTQPVSATPFDISGTTTTQQTLGSAAGETGTVEISGNLSVALTSGSDLGVSLSTGTSTLNNFGTIQTTGTISGTNAGKNRALRNNATGATITINNYSTGVIKTAAADVFQMNVAGSTVTLNNYGTMSSTGAGDQVINWNYGVQTSPGATGSAVGTVIASNNVLNNYAGGSITSFEADAVRPNAGAFINNSGTIKSSGAANDTSSSDGIDTQINNSGVTIVNAAGLGTGGASLIEGERHGITGGTDVNSSDGSGNGNTYDRAYTLSVTNNLGGTIQGDNGSGINIDGIDGTEVVTVVNSGSITGDGVTRDGDGIDVDGLLNLTNNSGAIVQSLNADADASEGVTVGGGTISNAGTIEGSTTGTSLYARGITLAGIDHTESGTSTVTDTDIPIQSIYANTTVTNLSGGLIRGDTESGITVLGTTGGAKTVTINNNAGGTIRGSNTGLSERRTGAASGASLNQAVIELDDTSNTYVINESGTITQDTTATGTAVAMHGFSSTGIANTLNITGATALITGAISGDSAADSVLNISPVSG